MKPKKRVRYLMAAGAIFVLSGCATIINDPNIPITVSFSDGSAGQCEFKNKRGMWSTEVPTTNVMIRRSDDDLAYDCSTKDGREASGLIRSEMEGGKMAASVIFWDLGITDAITDKHRTYQGNVVIPVEPKEGTAKDAVAPPTGEDTSVESGSDSARVEERLKQLESLKKQGLITAEEYEKSRADILQKL